VHSVSGYTKIFAAIHYSSVSRRRPADGVSNLEMAGHSKCGRVMCLCTVHESCHKFYTELKHAGKENLDSDRIGGISV